MDSSYSSDQSQGAPELSNSANDAAPEKARPSSQDRPKGKRRAQVIVACNACRARKLKCSADRPTCTACASRRITCTYEAEPNSTRAATLKRKHAILEQDAAKLTDLVELLRYRPQNDTLEILQRLRRGEDVSSILRHATHGDLAPQARPTAFGTQSSTSTSSYAEIESFAQEWQEFGFVRLFPETEPWRQRARQPQQDKRMKLDSLLENYTEQHRPGISTSPLRNLGAQAAHRKGSSFNQDSISTAKPLPDDRLRRAKAERWTVIQIEDEVMANLIAVYLSWFHKLYPFFVEDYFITDLVAGRTDYCTPSLVNAICSYACLQCSLVDPYARSLKPLFLEHTRRLLESGTEGTTINTLAATTIVALIELTDVGVKGIRYLARAESMARQLGLMDQSSKVDLSPDPHLAKLQRAKSVGVWSLHCLYSQCSLAYIGGSFLGQRPTVPPRYDDSMDPGSDRMMGWPCDGTVDYITSPSRYGPLCSLSEYINQCLALRERLQSTVGGTNAVAPDDVASYRIAFFLLLKILRWHEQLEPLMRRSADAPPHVLELHMMMYSTIMEIFRPFTAKDNFASQIFEASHKQLRALITQSRTQWDGPPNMLTSVAFLHRAAYQALKDVGRVDGSPDFFMLCLEALFETGMGGGSGLLSSMCLDLLHEARRREVDLLRRAREIEAALTRGKDDPNVLAIDYDGERPMDSKPLPDLIQQSFETLSLE